MLKFYSFIVLCRWKIQYLQYGGFNDVDLPTDILLSNPLMKIHLAIKKWEMK